jgi:hypothetical protein
MKLKDVSKELVAHALYDGILSLLGLIVLWSTSLITSKLLSEYIEALKDYKPYLIIMFISTGLLIFIYVYRKIRQYKPAFPSLDFDFRVLEKEVTLDISNENNMYYKKRVVLKSLKNNINAYHDKYHWTGSNEISITCNIKSHKFQKTIRKNIWQCYEILFQRTLKKGENMETELTWDLKDTDGTMVPFISSTIEEPTDSLIMNLSFPENTHVSEVVCEVSSSIGGLKPFETNTIVLDRNRRAVWRVRNPKLLFHYEMTWCN